MMMNRYEQQRRKRFQNPEISAGYREMSAELALVQALETIREHLKISKEELATRMGRSRASISRLFNDEDANPTLETITELLTSLGITAAIALRRSTNDEQPIHIETVL